MDLTIGYILLAVVSLIGLLTCLVGLPGVWLIFGGALAFDAVFGWDRIHWAVLAGLGILAVIGSVVDDLVAGIGAARYGGSRGASFAAIVGSLLGAIFISGLIPIPVLGTLIGAFGGAYAAAYLWEYNRQKDKQLAARAAWGAFVGKVGGILLKFFCGLIMVVLISWQLLVHR